MTEHSEHADRPEPAEPEGAAPLAPGASGQHPAQLQLPGKPTSDGWHRMHPFTPLLQGGLFLIVIASILIANLRDRLIQIFVGDSWSNEGGDVIDLVVENGFVVIVLGGVLGIILLIVLFSWLSWRVHTYQVSAEAVEAREGLLFKKHRRAPLERIQSVNLQRPLLARALGLTKIEVQTAGQGGKVELSYLAHTDAKQLREQILASAAAATGNSSTAPGAEAAGPTGTPRAVAHDGTPYSEARSGLEQRVQGFVDFDIAANESGSLVRVPVGRLIASLLLSWEMFSFVVAATGIIIASFWTPGILAMLVLLLLVFGGILISQFNKGFNFALSHTSDGVRVGSGLTSTNTETIPFGRIHAIEARQPLGWRPFGWWWMHITTAGHSVAQAGQNQNKNIVLPVGSETDVLRVLETLLPGLGASDEQLAALHDGLLGSGVGYTSGGRRSAALLWFAKRRTGLRIEGASPGEVPEDDATLRIRRGALVRSFAIMPVVRAQSVQLHRPLLHRMLGLASVQLHTVLGPVRMEMRGLDLVDAHQIFDELSSTVVAVQSRESERRAAGAAQGGSE